MARELIKFYRILIPQGQQPPKQEQVAYLEGIDRYDVYSVMVGEVAKQFVTGYNDFQYEVLEEKGDAGIAGLYVRPGNDPNTQNRLYIRGSLKDTPSDATQKVYEMYVNPQNISVEESKLVQKLRTRGGFVFQYWGADISKITVQGKTGSLVPPTPGQSVYTTDAYRALDDLRTCYHNDHVDASDNTSVLAMYYRRHVYVGHFDSFTFRETAENPYVWEYGFAFSVHEDAASLNLAQSRLANRAAIDAYTLDWLRNLYQKSQTP